MELVLRGLTWEKCLCYLDDVIVFGKTFEEALQNHRIIFQRLRNANMKLKLSKCSLFQTECRFLGQIVSEAGISCDPTKLELVQSWPVPTNVSEVRSFLGLVGYYRRFIKDFSTVAYPLTELTHKSKSFIWTEACQIAYETLKSSLISDNILAYPIENGDFIFDTDASLHGCKFTRNRRSTLSSAVWRRKSYCICKQNVEQISTEILHNLRRIVSSSNFHKTIQALSLGMQVYCQIGSFLLKMDLKL